MPDDTQFAFTIFAGTVSRDFVVVDAMEQLVKQLAQRCEDQRDSDDPAVPDAAISTAARLLASIGGQVSVSPDIELGSDGSLGILWRDQGTVAYVDILPNGYLRTLLRRPGSQDEQIIGVTDDVIRATIEATAATFAMAGAEAAGGPWLGTPGFQSLCPA